MGRADILFIDLDYSPSEIDAANAAALERNEKLVVVPLRTPDEETKMKEIKTLLDQRNRVKRVSHKIWVDFTRVQQKYNQGIESPHPDFQALEKWKSKMNLLNQQYLAQRKLEDADRIALEVQIKEKMKDAHLFSLKELDLILGTYETYRQEGDSLFRTIVVSGHHDSTRYTGILGSFDLENIANAFKPYPNVKAAVKTVFASGCYSASPQWAYWWTDAFPSIQIVGGFDASGPDDERMAASDFITGLLVREEEARRVAETDTLSGNLEHFKEYVQSIPGFTLVNGAVAHPGIYTGMNRGTFLVSEIEKICTQEDLDKLLLDAPRVHALLKPNSSESSENIPCNTQTSWLRNYYTQLRLHEHCGTFPVTLRNQYAELTKEADQVLRLIFFPQVFANFKSYYQKDLKGLDPLTEECNLETFDLKSPIQCVNDNGEPSRGQTRNELSKQIANLYKCDLKKEPPLPPKKPFDFIKQIGKPPPPKPPKIKTPEHIRLEHLRDRMDIFLNKLKCIPLNWIEPPLGKGLDRPECMERSRT